MRARVCFAGGVAADFKPKFDILNIRTGYTSRPV